MMEYESEDTNMKLHESDRAIMMDWLERQEGLPKAYALYSPMDGRFIGMYTAMAHAKRDAKARHMFSLVLLRNDGTLVWKN